MPVKKRNAYLTVYLALTLAVMLSLCLALIEGVRSNAVYMEAECVTDIGLNSILAEYHRELLRQYNLFAIDSSYGMPHPAVANTERHLANYLRKNLSKEDVALDWLLYRDFLGMSLNNAEMTKVSILTDGGGSVFRRRAAEAVWDELGIGLYQELEGWMRTVEINELTERNIAEEKKEYDESLEAHDGEKVKTAEEKWETIEDEQVKVVEEKWETVKVSNPTDVLNGMRNKGILNQVIKNPEEISTRTLQMENSIGTRAAAGVINQGNMVLPELSESEKLLERFFFQEYLLRYMGNYRRQSEDTALQYQIEYLIAGEENDTDNLRSVANALLAIREVSNTIHVFADAEKNNTAKLVGYALAALMLIPEAGGDIQTILLFGWALAESFHDVKCLFAGERVPLMKNSSTWYYDLETALTCADSEKGFQGDEISRGSGLSYEDYLRILMMLTNEDKLTMRAMNLVEADIRQTPGNADFRLDGCFDSVEACVGIESTFGYSCEITRQKGYSTQ